MGALWLVGRVTELIVTAVSRAAPASHWLAGWPRFGSGLLIGGEYQVAASPVKMCQLESEGAGVSGLRAVRARQLARKLFSLSGDGRPCSSACLLCSASDEY